MSIQYNEHDAMYDYQNLILYQMMVKNWAQHINQDTIQDNLNIILDDPVINQLIKSDLQQMHLMAYLSVYQDKDTNEILDFDVDSVLYSRDYTHMKDTFNYDNYQSDGDNQVLAQAILDVSHDNLWVSYGNYHANIPHLGTSILPATFVELPLQNNYILGVWLIMNYPLPADIDWPSIILPITLVGLLIILFWVIRSFLNPIHLIKNHVQNLKRGTLEQKIKIETEDELGELSKTINKMTQDINVLVNQKQNLLLDVSHELKTPLTRLKFIIANMTLPQENKISLNKEINFLQDMISNMLLSDKLSTPYIEDLEKSSVTTENLINDACNMFYNIQKRLKIKNHIPNYTLTVDKYKVSLGIKNLIDNALKYGGSDKLPELIIQDDDKYINITIKDYGQGLSESQIKKVFQPFYRGSRIKNKNHSGFGLGLAITQKIVSAHKGQLKINSIIKKGSEFSICLPKED